MYLMEVIHKFKVCIHINSTKEFHSLEKEFTSLYVFVLNFSSTSHLHIFNTFRRIWIFRKKKKKSSHAI